MSKIAFTFPGQGSQKIGMGKELYDNFTCAKAVLTEIDDRLDEKLSQIMFEGPEDLLRLTRNTQPALYAHSMAVLTVMWQEFGIKITPDFFAGHSLGEYSALCAAGCFDLGTGAGLLRLRGEAMQAAVPQGEGAMAALLGVSVEDASAMVVRLSDNGVVALANDNAPGQAVLSGEAAIINQAVQLAKEYGAKKAVLLPVSAPFHCPLMQPAAEKMQEALQDIVFDAPVAPIVPNILAIPEKDPQKLSGLLLEQVTGTVRWRETIQYLLDENVTHFVEIGTGKVLTGLAKRMAKEAKLFSLENTAQIEAFAAEMVQIETG